MNLYTVYDKTARSWQNPWAANNDVHALRSFRMEINRAHDQNALYLHPDDFELHRCGGFDQETGLISTQGTELVATGASVRKENL